MFSQLVYLRKVCFRVGDFEYSGKDFEPESEYDGPLPFPANLKHVSIKWASSVIIDLNTFVLPSRLKHLELWDIRFSQGHLQFNEDLEYVRIRTRTIRFPGDFRIPPLVKHFQIKATHLCFTNQILCIICPMD